MSNEVEVTKSGNPLVISGQSNTVEVQNNQNLIVVSDSSETSVTVTQSNNPIVVTKTNNEVVVNVDSKSLTITSVGVQGPVGTGGLLSYYAILHSTVDQTASSTTSSFPVTYNVTVESNGVTIASNSRIVIEHEGTYLFQFTGQFASTDSSDHDVNIWLRKNGTDISTTNSRLSVPAKHGSINGHALASVAYAVTLAANDYIEFVWATDSTNVNLDYIASSPSSPAYPATPSVVVAVTQLVYLQDFPLEDPSAFGVFTLDNSECALVTPPAGTMIHAANANDQITRINLDSFGSTAYGAITGRHSRGTCTTPTAVQSGDKLMEIGARGYGTTGWSSQSLGRVAIYANETWTDANQGSRVQIEVAANTTASTETVATFTAGSGNGLSLATGHVYKINNTSVLSATGLGSGVLSSSLTSTGTITSGTWQGSAVGLAYGGTGGTTAQTARTNILPSQSGKNGKFLQSDGTDVAWGTALTSIANETIDGGGA